MCDYQEIISDWDFLMYHHCIINDIPLDRMLHTSFCYDDMESDFWNSNYSEEQIISFINGFHEWYESTYNIQKGYQ